MHIIENLTENTAVNPLRLGEYWVHAGGLGRVLTNFWRERWLNEEFLERRLKTSFQDAQDALNCFLLVAILPINRFSPVYEEYK